MEKSVELSEKGKGGNFSTKLFAVAKMEGGGGAKL